MRDGQWLSVIVMVLCLALAGWLAWSEGRPPQDEEDE